jgi:hypothetical protein
MNVSGRQERSEFAENYVNMSLAVGRPGCEYHCRIFEPDEGF